MKKILVVLLLLLCGCSSDNGELSVVCPSGAPSLAFYNELHNDSFHTGDAQSILPELKSDVGSDIVVIDTVNGIKALNAGANYKLAATITFGNFYIASTGIDDNGIMEDGDYIVLFSKGATPDLIFHYLYGNEMESNIHYVSAVSDASACLIKGINISDDQRTIDEDPYVEYVMIAEPALSVALLKNDKASIYLDVQEEYMNKSDGLFMIQASVFVSNRLSNEIVDEFLNSLENNINSLLDNPNLFIEETSELSDDEIKDIFGVPNGKIASKILSDNSIGLGYRRSYEIKDTIDRMLNIFDVGKTNEEIYYK